MTRATVDMSLTLDIRTFVREGWWRPDKTLRYGSRWTLHGQPAGAVNWIAYPDSLQLLYATTDMHGERTVRDDLIPIQQNVDRLARQRVWFFCPGCARRILTLHMPARRGAIWFRCRRCYGLSYNSRQEYKSVFGKLYDRLLRLDARIHRTPLKPPDNLDALVQEADALGAAFENRLARDRQKYRQRCRGLIRRPPGRPNKEDARAVATWLRSKEPPAPVLAPRPPGRPKMKRAYVRRQQFELAPPTSDREAFCVRCRDRRPLKKARKVTLSNRRPALRGECAVCRTRLCRLLPSAHPH
jgi:hypothetical protein